MEVKDALTIMFLFGMFILALFHTLTTTRESKNPPQGCSPKVGFYCRYDLEGNKTIQANCIDQVLPALGLY